MSSERQITAHPPATSQMALLAAKPGAGAEPIARRLVDDDTYMTVGAILPALYMRALMHHLI